MLSGGLSARDWRKLSQGGRSSQGVADQYRQPMGQPHGILKDIHKRAPVYPVVGQHLILLFSALGDSWTGKDPKLRRTVSCEPCFGYTALCFILTHTIP
jgi:hypothetical protein